MKRADERAIASGTPAHVLMDRAGRAVARRVLHTLGRRYGGRVVVVCGRGNNGGDGFVAARVLAREGVGTACAFVGDLGSPSVETKHHLDELRVAGIEPVRFSSRVLHDADVVVDALFGTGFRGTVEGPAADAIRAIGERGPTVVAVDIPSGVDGATGAVRGAAVAADTTVALAAEKVGTAVGAGAARAGEVRVVDIGIDLNGIRPALYASTATDVAPTLPWRPLDAHKKSVGTVALVAGSSGMSGAVILAARGALRAGAGYVSIVCTSSVAGALAVAVPEAVLQVVDADVLGAEAIDRSRATLDAADVVVIGPGLGAGEQQQALVARALAELATPLVLDADGLNALAPQLHQARVRPPGSLAVATPHPAELGRLLGRPTDAVQDDRLRAVEDAAELLKSVVILKGFRSLVARTGRVVVNPTGGPELATAGTGDVLAGAVGALLSSSGDAFDASVAAAFVHGRAGSLAGDLRGGRGITATDVADALPAAVAETALALPSP